MTSEVQTAASDADPITHWEDLDWTIIEPAGIKLKIMAVKGGNPKGEPAIALIDYPADFYFPSHKHDVPHIEIVLGGLQYVGGREERAGAVRWVPANHVYGPLQMGPEGARIVEIFPNGDLPEVFGELVNPEELEPSVGCGMDSLMGQLGKLLG
jgi:hypothetical protein